MNRDDGKTKSLTRGGPEGLVGSLNGALYGFRVEWPGRGEFTEERFPYALGCLLGLGP
jgi:hypothetical protein